MSDLRIAVLGVGVMGADHVARITNRISNARVIVVNDYLSEKAEHVAASVPGARAVGDPLDAIADADVDAVVLATPGPTHEKQLLACMPTQKTLRSIGAWASRSFRMARPPPWRSSTLRFSRVISGAMVRG